MKLAFILLALLIVAPTIHAGILKIEKDNKTIEGITIGQSAELSTGAKTIKLDFIGAGLRDKKVLFIDVKVYVAQIFLDNASKFIRTSSEAAINSLSDMKSAAIHLTFLRNIDASTIQTSFKEALKTNDVDMSNSGIVNFLKAVKDGSEAKNGKSINISLNKEIDGTVKVTFENTKGVETTIIGDSKMFTSILSIWLGKSADAGLLTLKNTILKGASK